jgi:hypothetical protein
MRIGLNICDRTVVTEDKDRRHLDSEGGNSNYCSFLAFTLRYDPRAYRRRSDPTAYKRFTSKFLSA